MSIRSTWKELILKSLSKNSRLAYARYAQLATIRENGRPANRTIVYRGFLDDTHKLTFVTDRRSKKTLELKANPWVELCWYFPQTREQYRIAGSMTVVKVDESQSELLKARQGAWQRMSDNARCQFAWPHPGLERGSDDSLFQPAPIGKDEPVLDDFCLLILDPTEVDLLNLKSNERYIYKIKGEKDPDWSEHRVNP